MVKAIASGYAKIATAGTAVQLRSGGGGVAWVRIIAPLSNLHYLVVGSDDVTDDKTTTSAGYILAPGGKVELGECEIEDVYINGKVGDEVYYITGSN